MSQVNPLVDPVLLAGAHAGEEADAYLLGCKHLQHRVFMQKYSSFKYFPAAGLPGGSLS